VVTVVDDHGGTGTATLVLEILPEDARVEYHGPNFAATESAANGTATLGIRATIRDISSLPEDPDWDPWPGDVRSATVRFSERDSGTTLGDVLCDPVGVDEVFDPFDVFDAERSVGVASCDWTTVVAGDADIHDVATTAGGNYVRDDNGDDVVVTVARPLDDFITGGGYLVLERSAGEYAGFSGSHANFGFNVKFNKPRTNLQGKATLTVRGDDGRSYRIKANSFDSLGAHDSAAEFQSKASITDVTDPSNPISLDGNLVLQMTMTDGGDADDDTISFTLWDLRRTGNGKQARTTQYLLFSSHWTGSRTIEQSLGGGNLLVHAR
jgi:hypothetical protein